MDQTVTVAAVIPSLSAAMNAAAHMGKVDNVAFVFHTDLLLLAFLALFALFALPRAAVRFARFSAWTEGLVLYHVRPSALRRMRSTRNPHEKHPGYTPGSELILADNRSQKSITVSDEDQDQTTATSHRNLIRNASTSSGRPRRHPCPDPPRHMPSWASIFPRIGGLANAPVRPGLSVGKVVLLLGYFGVMLYAGLYKANPFTAPARTGLLATCQMPVVVLLAGKNNLIGVLVGTSYTKLNYLHRFAGRILVLAANIHALAYFYSWSIAGTFISHIAKPEYAWGLAALIAADILAFFSTSLTRQVCYTIFFAVHTVAFIILLVATILHEPSTLPYIFAAAFAYALDRLLRLVRTRLSSARIHALPTLGMTYIEVPGLNAGWRAGQHVRVRVLARGMGLVGWAECHPFSIMSVNKAPGGEGLVLMAKKAGDWTEKLFELAKRADYGEAGGAEPRVRVLVEGPYGGPGHAVFSSFSGALFVAGGSGITYALGAVQDVMQKDGEGASRLKAVHLIWAVQDAASITPLLPLFTSLLTRPSYATLRISIHCTRPSSAPVKLPHIPFLKLASGRPPLSLALTSTIDEACALFRKGREGPRGAPAGVVVGVCGPLGLVEDVKAAVRGVETRRREAVGGVEVYEEVFGS